MNKKVKLAMILATIVILIIAIIIIIMMISKFIRPSEVKQNKSAENELEVKELSKNDQKKLTDALQDKTVKFVNLCAEQGKIDKDDYDAFVKEIRELAIEPEVTLGVKRLNEDEEYYDLDDNSLMHFVNKEGLFRLNEGELVFAEVTTNYDNVSSWHEMYVDPSSDDEYSNYDKLREKTLGFLSNCIENRNISYIEYKKFLADLEELEPKVSFKIQRISDEERASLNYKPGDSVYEDGLDYHDIEDEEIKDELDNGNDYELELIDYLYIDVVTNNDDINYKCVEMVTAKK